MFVFFISMLVLNSLAETSEHIKSLAFLKSTPPDTVYIYDTLQLSYVANLNYTPKTLEGLKQTKFRSLEPLMAPTTNKLQQKHNAQKYRKRKKISMDGITSLFFGTEMFRDVFGLNFLPNDIEIQSEYSNRDIFAAYSIGTTVGMELEGFTLRTGVSYSYFQSDYRSEAELSEFINYYDNANYEGNNPVFTLDWNGRQPSGNIYIAQWIIEQQDNMNGLDTITYKLNYEVTSRYSYFEFPLIIGYHFYVNHVKHIPQVGYIKGVYISPEAKATLETPFDQETITLTNEVPPNADFLYFSWHISYQLSRKTRLFSEPFIKTSFNNIQTDNILVRNQSVGFRFGINFLF